MTAERNDGPRAEDARAATTNTPREGNAMIIARSEEMEVSVCNVRYIYATGVTSAEIMCVLEDMAYTVPVTLKGIPQKAATGYINAIGRLMCGAIVMDHADFMAIRDSLDNARGVA